MRNKILISACLLGARVRYDGGHAGLSSRLLEKWSEEGRLVPICPEVLSGLPTPRPAAEIQRVNPDSFRVFEDTNRDVTDFFVRGAELALELALANSCRFALLKDGSPSCGTEYVNDGSFTGHRVAEYGVTSALLVKHGVTVYPDSRIFELATAIAQD